jgi:hypothetical protein
MFLDSDIIRKEIKNGVKGNIYLCKNCNNEIFKTKYYATKCTGYCKSCNAKIHLKKNFEELITKKCKTCKRDLDISNFSFTGSNFYRSSCITCSNLKSVFNISYTDYTSILNKQNNVCAICKLSEKAFDKKGKVRNLAVDHDHDTGNVRGLLCTNCNTALGHLKDNINILYNAIKYLKKYDKNKI